MSAANRGSEREELDGYWTPFPCALAICERLLADKIVSPNDAVLEPSIGKGAFAAAVAQVLNPEVLVGVDLQRQQALDAVPLDEFIEGDFLDYEPTEYFDAVIGNPPFADAEPHARHAMKMLDPETGVLAFLLRLNFLEGKDRTAGLWKEHPPSVVYVLNRRPSFKKTKKPKLDPLTGSPMFNKRTGKPLMVSSSNDATAYGVIVWRACERRSRGLPVPEPVVRWLEW